MMITRQSGPKEIKRDEWSGGCNPMNLWFSSSGSRIAINQGDKLSYLDSR